MSTSAFADSPKAKELLANAEKLHAASDDVGATRTYLDAVRLDPAAEDLELIIRCRAMIWELNPIDEQKKRFQAGAELTREALRLYVAHHPDEWTGIFRLSDVDHDLGRTDEEEKLITDYLGRHPRSSYARHALSGFHQRQGRMAEAFGDLEALGKLFPCDEFVPYSMGLTAYMAAQENLTQPSPLREETLHRGEAGDRRALEMKPDDDRAMSNLALLLRQEAKTKDAVHAAALNKEADEWWQRGKAIRTKREEERKGKAPLKWDVMIRQGADNFSYASGGQLIVHLHRTAFRVEVHQPSVSAIRIAIAGDDGKARPVPDLSPEFTRTFRDDHVTSYVIATVDGIPIASRGDCRLYLTVLRGDQPIKMIVQFD